MNCHPHIPSPSALTPWRGLEQAACEPAPQAAHFWLHAALTHLPVRDRPWLARVEDPDDALPLAIAGLRKTRRFGPLGRLASTRWGEFFFSGLPLLRQGAERQALDGLLWAASGMGAKAMELASIPAQGPVMAALKQVAGDKGLLVKEMVHWRRAALDARQSPAQWWQDDIPRKKRKEYARLMRRLKEAGEVSFQIMKTGEDPSPWIDDFLALEARGWKGRAGTAIACKPALRHFVEAALRAAAAAGALRFWRLSLNERTIAILFGFVQDENLWLGKMAHAEDLGRYSPGVLLIIEATRDILADPRITFADSCAAPHHPMIDRLWKQRLALTDVVIAAPGVLAPRVRLMLMLEALCLRARTMLKRLWHGLRARLGGKRKRAA